MSRFQSKQEYRERQGQQPTVATSVVHPQEDEDQGDSDGVETRECTAEEVRMILDGLVELRASVGAQLKRLQGMVPQNLVAIKLVGARREGLDRFIEELKGPVVFLVQRGGQEGESDDNHLRD